MLLLLRLQLLRLQLATQVDVHLHGSVSASTAQTAQKTLFELVWLAKPAATAGHNHHHA